MKTNSDNNGSFNLGDDELQDKDLVLNYIRSTVEKGTGLTYENLKTEYSEEQLFYISLKHVTTTKKALCTAMGIPVEAGCRYKRTYEKEGLLVQSTDEVPCPYTNHFARLLTTNSELFEAIQVPNQTKFLEDGETKG